MKKQEYKQIFQGLYPALITPFKENGEVNEKVLPQLIDRLLEQNAEGLYLMGSTAEAFLMTNDQRSKTFNLIAKHVKGRCRLIAQVGSLETKACTDMAKNAYDNGADMISAVAPYYYKHSFEELKAYFLSIAETTPLPFLLYNFPGYSGVSYEIEQLIEISSNPSVVGIKYTDMDLYKLERIQNKKPDLLLFNGHDEVYLAACALGVKNAIGSTFNIMLPKFQNIKLLVEKNNWEAARKEQEQANDVIEALIKVGVIPGIKYILSKKGYDVGLCRKPFSELKAENRKIIDDVMNFLEPSY